MTDDMDFPRLTPQGERLPSGGRLFRRAGELTDEQFDLLAAAWSGDALDGEALAEFEEVVSAIPGRRDRAESFRNLHLTPTTESWPGMRSCLRLSPGRVMLHRAVLPVFMAAAVLAALIIMGPAGDKLKTTISTENIAGPVALTTAENVAGPVAMTTAEIPVSHPIIAAKKAYVPRTGLRAGREDQVPANLPDNLPAAEVEQVRAMPLVLGYGQAGPSNVAPRAEAGISTLSIKEISTSIIVQEDKNWILRSISYIAGALAGKEKDVNGYMIANGCITGINNALGWEMELEQITNSKGNPVAVNFSSSLLSFKKPLNKNSP